MSCGHDTGDVEVRDRSGRIYRVCAACHAEDEGAREQSRGLALAWLLGTPLPPVAMSAT